MTVFNTGYSNIEEAWGDLTGKSKKDINRKKKNQDPICELYDAKAKSNSNYSENDLVNFANEYYEKFDKNKYQRNMQTQSLSYEDIEREPSPKSLVIKQEQSKYETIPSISPYPSSPSSPYPPSHPSPSYPSPSYPSPSLSPSPNTSLFEKQFEINLPPLYSGECDNDNDNDNGNGNGKYQESSNTFQENQNVYSENERRPIYSEGERKHSERRIVNSERNLEDERRIDERRLEDERRVDERRAEDERRSVYSERQIYTDKSKSFNNEKKKIYSERDRYFDDSNDSHNNYQSYRKKNSNFQILDLILYIISGIILIFLLEQFVKIGINMQR